MASRLDIPNRPSAPHWWILGFVLLVAACGWQPLYSRPSPDPTSGGVTTSLAAIAIDPITTKTALDPLTSGAKYPYDARAAQMLHNYLRDALNPYGQPRQPAYHLIVELTEALTRTASLGNGDSTRDDLALTAKYNLLDAKGQSVLQ